MNNSKLLLPLLLFLSVACFSNLSASTITVMNTNNEGAGSLRDAVAAMPDTILFDVGINGDTIKLVTQITISQDLVIIGNDSTQTIIDGMGDSRIFDITSGNTVLIEDLTVQNGGGVTQGGGIRSRGELTIKECLITKNTLITTNLNQGAGLYNLNGILTIIGSTISKNKITLNATTNRKAEGGGVYNSGTSAILKIENSIIINNSANSTNVGSAVGGGIYNLQGEIELLNSVISNNTVSSKFSLAIGGGVRSLGKMTIDNCEINGNHVISTLGGGSGGGVSVEFGELIMYNTVIQGNEITALGDAQGGGLNFSGSSSSVKVYNSVFSGNKTLSTDIDPSSSSNSQGGGLRLSGGSATLANCSIVGNQASNAKPLGTERGGGIYVLFSNTTLTNTIVAKNFAASGADIDIFSGSTVSDAGNNHVMDPSGNHNITDGNNVDPLFITDVPAAPTTGGDLRLADASPDVDAGTPDTTGLDLRLIDINGLSRVQGGAIDIGAHERAKLHFEYSDCSQVNIDLDAALLSLTDPLNLYRAQLELKSDVTLSRDVTVKAGQMILFNENFTVNQGTILEAIIEACPN